MRWRYRFLGHNTHWTWKNRSLVRQNVSLAIVPTNRDSKSHWWRNDGFSFLYHHGNSDYLSMYDFFSRPPSHVVLIHEETLQRMLDLRFSAIHPLHAFQQQNLSTESHVMFQSRPWLTLTCMESFKTRIGKQTKQGMHILRSDLRWIEIHDKN